MARSLASFSKSSCRMDVGSADIGVECVLAQDGSVREVGMMPKDHVCNHFMPRVRNSLFGTHTWDKI